MALVASREQRGENPQGLVLGPVPLTPIQINFFEQGSPEPHHFNQSVLLEGSNLDPVCLKLAAERLVEHHDALRLRFRAEGPDWLQWEAEPGHTAVFSHIDLTGIPSPRDILEELAEQLQTGLDLGCGPLIRIALFSLADGADRLLIVIHHLAVDGVSWRILLEDLTSAYQQALRQHAITLPPKTASFQQWSESLREYALSQLSAADATYWLESNRRRTGDLPVDYDTGPNTEASARTLMVSLSQEETDHLLRRVPPVYHTEINDLLLAATTWALSDWTGCQNVLIDIEGHGRQEVLGEIDVSRTVGWFTSIHPAAIEVSQTKHPGEVLKSVKEQIRAIPHKGFTYGLLRYITPHVKDALAGQQRAEISFNHLGQLDNVLAGGSLFTRAGESDGLKRTPRRKRQYLIEINTAVVQGKLQVVYTYSANRHRAGTLEWLAASHLSALRAIVGHCLSPEAGGYTPSDFPLASLTQEETDWLLSRYPDLEDVYPLSAMQQGLLFHVLHQPGTDEYFEQFSCRLRGKLEPNALRKAWNEVVQRHTSLKTAFCWGHLRNVVQVVMRQVALEWQYLNLGTQVSDEAEARLAEFRAADRKRGFVLNEAPLMRIALIQLDQEEYELVWSHHHLVFDGWSGPIVLREVFSLYDASIGNSNIDLEPARPYRNYIEWLGGQDFNSAKSFWQLELKGFSEQSGYKAGTAWSGAASPSHKYTEERILLSGPTTASLQAAARGSQVTLNTVFQGAWAILLSRHLRQSDVVFGATVSGRSTPLTDVERMVGLFINTLPVRVIVESAASLDKWLQTLQRRQADVRQFEHTPLSSIQSWCGAGAGSPLFDSLLAFENYPIDLALGEEIGRQAQLNVIRILAKEQTNYPLTLIVSPARQISIRLIYDKGLFDACSIVRMLAHLDTLLENVIAS
ncbi:MAG TPA: condensation domain-containing protein, partial [Blastocatellia bacterium]|nr:condensation domain-containing protein [Blastocatellia bacterium]